MAMSDTPNMLASPSSRSLLLMHFYSEIQCSEINTMFKMSAL